MTGFTDCGIIHEGQSYVKRKDAENYYHVGVYRKDHVTGEIDYVCGGTIINTLTVLTGLLLLMLRSWVQSYILAFASRL